MMFRAPLSTAVAIAAVCAAFALQKPAAVPGVPAQAAALMPPSRPGDTLVMNTHVGSFKILPKGEELPSGRLEFSFTGTVLFTGVDPASVLQVSGNVRKEYDNAKQGKQVYFGTGKILLVGKFRNCQWFGRDLNFRFKGSAVIRAIAEFDKNLQTGTYWYDGSEKLPMLNTMNTLPVPELRVVQQKAVTREELERRRKAKGGGGR